MMQCQTVQSSYTFDPVEATIQTVHQAIFTHGVSCRQIVAAFLARIDTINPKINALICLNPDALSDADSLDERLARGEQWGPLFGVPVILKDNFNTSNMKTTGGCLALKDLQATEDAPVVSALKGAGAIVLGKANLHEMALEGLSVSSLGGQTLNPYDLTRTPGGSSGGSGAAVAASLCVFATGTDTVNSLRSPASANSLVSCRPTRGLVSRAGIMPISFTQDVAGPIARCTQDLATVLSVMGGALPGGRDADPQTSVRPESAERLVYTRLLAGRPLAGLRIGVLSGFLSPALDAETIPVKQAMDSAVRTFQANGVTIVHVDDAVYDAQHLLATLDTQRFEYRDALDNYLANPGLVGDRPRNFHELYSSKDFLVIPAQYEYIKTAAVSSTSSPACKLVRQGIADLEATLSATFAHHRLDAFIYPQQKRLTVKVGSPSQAGRNGILAALTGYPSVCVPAGFSPPTTDAPIGVPIGMELLGQPWTEQKLLQIAYQFEQLTQIRKPPVFGEENADSDAQASQVVSAAYPLGVLQ